MSDPQKTSEQEPVQSPGGKTYPPLEPEDESPQPKIYAPLLYQLENYYPQLADRVVGVGDRPVTFDDRKREVEVRFKSDAGTQFGGKFHTEPANAGEDAKEFLNRMVQKLDATNATDKEVLEGPREVVPQPIERPPGAVADADPAALRDGKPYYAPLPPPGVNPPEKPVDHGGAAEGELDATLENGPHGPELVQGKNDDDADWNEPTKESERQ